MSDIADLMGSASGPAYSFTHRGKRYDFSYLTQTKKAEYAKRLRGQAFAMLAEMRPYLAPEEYERDKANLIHQASMGAYSFHSGRCFEAIGTNDGALMLGAVLAGIGEEEIIQLAAEAPDKLKTAVQLVFAVSAAPQEGGEGNVPAASPVPAATTPMPTTAG